MNPSELLCQLTESEPEAHQEHRPAEALYQEQVQYRILVEESPLGIAIIGPQGKHLYLNPRFVEIFGYTREEIPTFEAAMARLYPEARYRQKVVSAWLNDTRELGPGKSASRIFAVICKNGEEKVINFKLVSLANNFWMVICEDINECHQAREALMESERRFRQLVEQAADAVFLHDKGKIAMVNQQACRSLGYGREELQQMTIADIEASISPLELQNLWEQAESPVTIRGVHRRKDGSTFPVEVRAGNIVYGGRRLRLALVRDITERLKIEEALRQSEIKYRMLGEAAPSGISIIGKDGRYKYLNPKFIKMFGYNLEDIPTGREFFPKAFPDAAYREMVIADWKVEFKKAQVGEVKARTYRVTCKDGSIKVIDFRPVALVTGDWLMFYEDISKRVEAEEALRHSEQKLRALTGQLLTAQEDERKRLAAELHDELGHALLTLKLSIGSLEKQLTPEQIAVTQEFKKIGRFIGETIKGVRRLYHDLSPGDLEDVGLTEALRDMLEDGAAQQQQIQWDVRLENLDGLFPLAVQTAIYRVVQEALTNIGKHARAKNVTIIANRQGHRMVISIVDDGRGFEAAKVLDTKTSLGLLTMEERVKILGGTFTLWSQKKGGTRISFSVPLPKGD